MKVVYVLSLNPAPRYTDRLEIAGVYLHEQDALSDGLDHFRNDPVVKEMYEEYISDYEDDDYCDGNPPTYEEYISEGDPYFMEVREMMVHQRSEKEVRENG